MNGSIRDLRSSFLPSARPKSHILPSVRSQSHLLPSQLCSQSVSKKGRDMVASISAVAAPEKPPQQRNLKTYTANEMSEADIKACISRPRVDFSSILNTVRFWLLRRIFSLQKI